MLHLSYIIICKEMNRKSFTITILFSVFFFTLVATNSIPQLRGPEPYPISWQWPYQADFFTPKLIVPLLVLSTIVAILWFSERKNSPRLPYLWILFLLLYFFQLSVLYFSRGGIGIVLQRVIDPGMSGYFTAATKIHDVQNFLGQYHLNMHTYYTHPRAHPAGFILFFWVINSISAMLTPLFKSMINNIHPHHLVVMQLWTKLSSAQQLGAVMAGFLIPFLAALVIIPVYKIVSIYADNKTALRAAALCGVIPPVFLFTPLPDVLFPVLSMIALYFLVEGTEKNKVWSFALSGFIISLAVFCGLNAVPLLLILLLYLVLRYNSVNLRSFMFFTGGFITLPVILITLGYHYVPVMIQAAVEGRAPRDYWTWLPFNLLDFFIYTGVPLIIVFIYSLKKKTKEKITTLKRLRTAFLITLLTLFLSGLTRGEVGRLWIVFMPLIVLLSSTYLKYFSTKQFLSIIVLQALQILILQGYWVSLW